MGIKGVPFGYLKLSRAIEGNHACAPPLPGPWAWAWVRVQLSPVLFELGHTGLIL